MHILHIYIYTHTNTHCILADFWPSKVVLKAETWNNITWADLRSAPHLKEYSEQARCIWTVWIKAINMHINTHCYTARGSIFKACPPSSLSSLNESTHLENSFKGNIVPPWCAKSGRHQDKTASNQLVWQRSDVNSLVWSAKQENCDLLSSLTPKQTADLTLMLKILSDINVPI